MIFDKLLLNSEEIKQNVLNSIKRKESLLLTYLNQHCLNIYFKDKAYKKLIDTNFTAYQADVGVYFAMKLFGKKNIERIDATAMNEKILNEIIRDEFPMMIVGGNFGEKFIRNEAVKNGIKLVAYHDGYFAESESDTVINYINGFETNLIVIGMGVPKQEIFGYKLSQSSGSKVIICVGNFFEFYFGTKKRAPVLMRKIGIEWIFRMFSEPLRLWKRYVIGIPAFFFQVIKLKYSESGDT